MKRLIISPENPLGIEAIYKPSVQDIENDQARLAIQYKQDRKEEYPDIGDQLDAIIKTFVLLHSHKVLLPPEMISIIEKCQRIKDKYPKRMQGEQHGD